MFVKKKTWVVSRQESEVLEKRLLSGRFRSQGFEGCVRLLQPSCCNVAPFDARLVRVEEDTCVCGGYERACAIAPFEGG